MSALDAKHRGLAILPEVFGRPLRQDPIHPMPQRYWVILAAVLIPPPLLALYLGFVAYPDALYHEHLAHTFVEAFCALIALVVFYVLRQEWKLTGGRRLGIMAHGFLLYGIVNLSHAFAPHDLNSFVFLHSIGGFVLALSMLAAVMDEGWRFQDFTRLRWERQEPRVITLAVVATGMIVALAGIYLAEHLPWRHLDGRFTVIANGVNIVSAALFAFSGLIFMRDFRRSREPILFSFGLSMLLFAETHALFPLSRLWDIMWWAWHGVKLAIFLGMLCGIAYECAQTLSDLFGANQALQRSHSELQLRSRDIETAYEQLATTQASLVHAERFAALGQMAAIVAHEIRNPLATIANCVGILKRPGLAPAEASRALALTECQVDRLDQIVNETLDFARAQVVRWQPVPIPAIVEQLIASCRNEAFGQILLIADVPNDLPFVDGSPQQLQQALGNLVVNAAEAMNGKGEILVRARAENASVVIQVIDTGPGIPADLRHRVFDPLFTTKPGGTGLGLVVVRNIIREHGGSVEIAASPRGGSVIVRLPSMTGGGIENREAAQ